MRPITPAELADWVGRRAAGRSRYVLGIAGPPGSGKSTIAARLAGEVGAPIVPMDGFHLPNDVLRDRGLIEIKGAPETFDGEAFVEIVRRLTRGDGPVSAPVFDREIDEPVADGVTVDGGAPVVIVEGNDLLLADAPWSELAGLLDDVVDVDAEVRIERLVTRHVA